MEDAFGQKLSAKFWINRTRQGFSNGRTDDFPSMARRGAEVMERVMTE
ncbi:hypothetical protein [Neolewinella persica]|nr:hypothetical protein [Neolewinella persica]